ncbi:MAG: FG-GAP-like repeat-containing protein [Pyrinomonadaceae bacterium]
MKRFKYWFFLPLAFIVVITTVSTVIDPTSASLQNQPLAAAREEAYRANNIGVALLEQFKYKEAADAFKRALQLDPKSPLARINLGIALYNLPDLPGAQREMQTAITLAPTAPQPHYILGLTAKTQNRAEDAIAAFQRVLKIDPNDVGTNINLGQLYAQQRKYPEAIAVLRTALAAEPYNATALYNLGTSLMRSGQRDEGQNVIKQFQELRQRGSGSTIGTNYLEQGRYAEAIVSTGAEPELVDRAVPAVAFTDATAEILPGRAKAPESGIPPSPLLGREFKSGGLNDAARSELAAGLGGNVTLFDSDLDGDLDIFWVAPVEQRFYRNDGGKFTDITAQSGALNAKPISTGVGAVAGDYDNDGKPDLFVIRYGSLALYHNDGGGKFSDVTAASGIAAYPYLPSSAAFVDVDHDGDLDVFVAGLADLSKPLKGGEPAVFPDDFAGAPNTLLRNDGTGKFTDITAAAKLDRIGHTTVVVPTDFNNKRDVDLLVADYGKAPELFSNLRDGSFRNVANEIGLGNGGRWTAVAAGDVNKDGYTDFFFGQADGLAVFAISDGQEKFKTVPAPNGSEAVSAAQFLDYDNDGLLDCLALTDKGLRVWRNVGNDTNASGATPPASPKWMDVSERARTNERAGGPLQVNASRLFGAGDIDQDGDEDFVFLSSSGELRVARNDGGNLNRSLRVNLAGKVSNRSGVGAKIEARAGSLVQKIETYSASPAPAPADVLFGLGKRTAPDAVRVLWPAGIVQAETELAKVPPGKSSSALTLAVTELDRKPSSCPYLYVWNGERFEFVTDFLGGGEMGHLEEPGRYNAPDPDEYVRIRGDQLKERHGRYELRVTNELEEALFVDKLQLIAVAHPQGVEVYPNEGLTGPPLPPFKLYATSAAKAPASAVDDHGHDVLSRIARLDREYPDDFRLHQIRGFADEHTLTLKLFEAEPVKEKSKVRSERTLLLLTGWTDYAWSSDTLAASQSGKSLMLPALQVKDVRGRWRTVIENIGIPVGRPQTVTVDLTGKFLSSNREVRIVTNMRIYWDQILVGTSGNDSSILTTKLDPVVANLRWRGFSRELSLDGRQPLGYDYAQVSFTSPWKVMTGRYTREGDVRELMIKSDDMFVISRPGDEISLSFDAGKLPPLPRGWTRTFLLYADGFSKEMDINSASPDQISPLPFHGMSRYPYTWPERYPLTKERLKYLETYNTRVVASPVPKIETEFIGRRESTVMSNE